MKTWILVIEMMLGGIAWGAGNLVSIRTVDSALSREPSLAPVIQAVVRIETSLNPHQVKLASGFFASGHQILTAGHAVAQLLPDLASASPKCTDGTCAEHAGRSSGQPNAAQKKWKIAGCEEIHIQGVADAKGKPRSYKCRKVAFFDPDADVALIEVFASSEHWIKLGADDSLAPAARIDLLGYLDGGYLLHTRECRILTARETRNLDDGHGVIRTASKFFSSRCLSEASVSGGPVLSFGAGASPVAIGLVTGGRDLTDTIMARLPDLIRQHPDQFQFADAAGVTQ